MTLEQLLERGFDKSFDSTYDSHMKRGIQVGCSQCEVTVINGVPCHETGCLNEKHECAECDALIPKGRRLCESCAHEDDDFGWGTDPWGDLK